MPEIQLKAFPNHEMLMAADSLYWDLKAKLRELKSIHGFLDPYMYAHTRNEIRKHEIMFQNIEQQLLKECPRQLNIT